MSPMYIPKCKHSYCTHTYTCMHPYMCMCVITWAPCRHLLLKKYDWHIAYLSHTANILNGHIEPTFLLICAETQLTAIHTSHVIAKHMLETNMPTNLGIYAKYLIYMEDVYAYMSYIWSHCNQPCDNGHCTHIWHISLNKYGCHIAHICSSALLLQCTLRPVISTHIPQWFSLWY